VNATGRFLTFCFVMCGVLHSKPVAHKKHLMARFSQPCYHVKQGRTVRAVIQTNKPLRAAQVKFLSKTYRLLPNAKKKYHYECFVPVECEGCAGKHPLRARVCERNGGWRYLKGQVAIQKVTFPKQKGFRVSSASLRAKLAKEGRRCKQTGIVGSPQIKRALKRSPRKRYWSGPFRLPSQVLRYSTPFGEIRRNEHWGRYLHRAVDIVSPVRSPVRASESGKVII